MFLNEEYYLRHDIDAPLVKAQDRSSLIFRSTSKKWNVPWIIFEIIKVHEISYHPPHFDFRFLQPLHDGCEKSNFTKNISNKQVFFDEYETEIVTHTDNFIGLEPIDSLAEAKMASWEMFLYCNDYRLCNIPIRLKDYLWESIDLDLHIEKRMQSQEKVISGLQRGSSLSARWEIVSQYCNPLWYADWYAKIINNTRQKSNYRSEYSNIRSIA